MKGSLIIELIVSISVFSAVLAVLFGLVAFSMQNSNNFKSQVAALNLAEESIEAARAIRDTASWDSGIALMVAGSPYHPVASGNPLSWQMSAGAESTGVFTRQIVFYNVNRDGNGNIVLSGGTDDPDTRKAVSIVSWGNKQVEISAYITNWKNE